MTGAYLRVKRNGSYEPIEVEHLTDDERFLLLGHREPAEIMRWLDLVCNKLAQVEREHFVRVDDHD